VPFIAQKRQMEHFMDRRLRIMFGAVGSENISTEYVSAMLKAHGHQCAIAFDRALFDDKQYFSFPKLAKFFDDRDEVVQEILDYRPDVLAFTVFADNFQWCLDISRRVKRHLNVPVILGGIHPSSAPETCIAQPEVDVICLGDGEYPMLEYVESLARGEVDYTIKNLWFRRDGDVIKNPLRPNPDINALPPPDKELFAEHVPIGRYYLSVTNKGCVSTCAFCCENFYYDFGKQNKLGRFFRERSVDSVIAEFKDAESKYGVEYIDIKNNVLSNSLDWQFEFLRRYKQEVGVPFRIMGYPKLMTAEISRALVDAGCKHVQMGVQSLNQKIRSGVLNRHETDEDIYMAVDGMEAAGLDYSTDIMVGIPGESDEDIEMAIRWLADKKHLRRASIFWLEYAANTQITRYAHENNYINEDDMRAVEEGRQNNYLSTGSVNEKEIRDRLFNYHMLFRLLPVTPAWLTNFILRTRAYRFFRYVPQIPIIITVDILVSIVRRDKWAMFAMSEYLRVIKKRSMRYFQRRFGGGKGGSGFGPLKEQKIPGS